MASQCDPCYFRHTDPTGALKGLDANSNVARYTAGDLAATMSLYVDLKVFSANGYYDFVTPFYQTTLDLKGMPLLDADVRKNLSAGFYLCGHMVYLDGGSRTALKADLARRYDAATADHQAVARIRTLRARKACTARGSVAAPSIATVIRAIVRVVVVVTAGRYDHAGAQRGRSGSGKNEQGKDAFHDEAPVLSLDCLDCMETPRNRALPFVSKTAPARQAIGAGTVLGAAVHLATVICRYVCGPIMEPRGDCLRGATIFHKIIGGVLTDRRDKPEIGKTANVGRSSSRARRRLPFIRRCQGALRSTTPCGD